jgi:glycyl-tRNA synthetase
LVVPLSSKDDFKPLVRQVLQKLRAAGISSRVDDSSASIGKRYARNDELGTPFGITVDFQTIKDGSITLRERDSTRQVRADMDKIVSAIQTLVSDSKTWQDVESELPKFEGQELEVR